MQTATRRGVQWGVLALPCFGVMQQLCSETAAPGQFQRAGAQGR